MKKYILSMVLVIIMLSSIIGCNPNVSINFKAEAVNGTAGASKSIDMGNGVIVDEYNVTFYKVEIGNSEEDKFTLWESTDGEEKNLVGSVTFTNVNSVVPGTYQFCRMTIHKTIELTGVDGSTAGTAYVNVTGNFSSDDPKELFLFGTDDAPGNPNGEFLLTSAIGISEGTTLTFVVNIAGTVTGDGIGNITLNIPSLTFTSE